MKRVLCFIAVLAVCVSLIPTEALASDNSVLPQDIKALCNQESWEVLGRTNKLRIAHGALPVTTFGTLQVASNIRADEQIILYSHTRPDGRKCFTVFDDIGLEVWAAAENIAMGQPTPAVVVDGWYNSPGHRVNMLSTQFFHGSMGFNSNRWVQLFMSENCRITDMKLILPEGGCVITRGHEVEDSGAAAELTCSAHGKCYMPVISEMCTGADLNRVGTYTVTASYGKFKKDFSLKVIDEITEGDFTAYINGGSATIIGWSGRAGKEVHVPGMIGGYPVTALADGLFKNASLKDLTLPESLKVIGSECFEEAYLPEIVIPENVRSIGSKAYYNAKITGSGSIYIPESVENIGAHAFSYISRAESITVDAANRHYSSHEGVLYNKDKTMLINYPVSKKDASYALPESVTILYDTAIVWQDNLKDLYVHSYKAEAMKYTFYGSAFNVWCHTDAPLYAQINNGTCVTDCNTFHISQTEVTVGAKFINVALCGQYSGGIYMLAGYDGNGQMTEVCSISGLEKIECEMPLSTEKLVLFSLDGNYIPKEEEKLIWEAK